MVGGQPLDFSGADEVGAGIADVCDGDLVVAKNDVSSVVDMRPCFWAA